MNKSLILKVLFEVAKRDISEAGPYLKIDTPDFVEKELSDKGLALQNLFKKDFPRQSLSQETKDWIRTELLPKLRAAGTSEVSENHNYAEQGTSMSKSELRDGIKNAIELYRLLQAGHQLPPWAAAYVTLSSDYLHSVNEYMVERAAQSMYQEGVEGEYDEETIQAMRNWIDDNQWEDLVDSKDLSDEEVIDGIERQYGGGIKQFMIDIK